MSGIGEGGSGGGGQGAGARKAAPVGDIDNRDPWGHRKKAPAQGGNNDDNEPNDDGIDDKQVQEIWNDIVPKKKEGEGDPAPGGQQQQQVDPNTQLQTYLKGVGLGEFGYTAEEKAQFAEGNFDAMASKTLQLVQTAHTKALSGASALIETKVADAVKKAVAETKGIMDGRALLSSLHEALPMTRNPAIGPVAQTVMQKFLDKGATTEQAIKGVKQWFKKAAELTGGTEVNSNRNTSFRGNSGETNWLDVLGTNSEE